MDIELKECLLGILQRGLVEARGFALCAQHKKAADLLDALDNLPRHIANWSVHSESEIEQQLEVFDTAYPDHETRYAELLRHRQQTL